MSADRFVEMVRAALAAGRTARVPVTGTSMLPTIPAGTVVVEPVDVDRVAVGDVIAYQHGTGVIVHRVVGLRAGQLVTAGDNMQLYDPPVPRAAVLGRVRGAARPDVAEPAGSATGWADAPGPVPDRVTLWLTGPAARAVAERDDAAAPTPGHTAPPVRIRHLPAGEPDVLSRAIAALPGVTVGISAAAVRPVERLGTALAEVTGAAAYHPERGVDIVIGCRYGRPALYSPARHAEPVIGPEIVDCHLRVGPPLDEIAPEQVVRRVLDTLDRLRSVQPAHLAGAR